ncbi:MAG TPA: hypothetical protein VG845_14825 [Dehalococcoidia bacterium]|jgi:hypothetical protein|nr:hypothetical protein [Dehalococcoidia bacterium]
MILLSPEGTSQEGRAPLAPRPGNLHGKRVGLLSNSKLNADAVLYAIGELLAERFEVTELVHRSKPNFSLPASEATFDELVANCDVVLAGVGD